MITIKDKEYEFKKRIEEKLKQDIFKAQRMYYLSQKLENRIPVNVRKYCKNTINIYTKMAKEMELKLTQEELYNKLLKE